MLRKRDSRALHQVRIPDCDAGWRREAVYCGVRAEDASDSKTYPILIERTPYSVGPYGTDNYPKHLGPAPSFVKDGFIFVYQDVRGRYQE